MWRAMTAGIEVPVSAAPRPLPGPGGHQRAACARAGTRCCSTRSTLPVEENQRQTVEVVAEARRYGAHVEGEIEAITGVEDGIGSDERGGPAVAGRSRWTSSGRPGSTCSRRRSATPTASTAPRRHLDAQRVSDIVAAEPHPDRAARRHRDDGRPVHRPDRPRLRQGEHLDGPQAHVHEGEPGVPERGRGPGTSGTRRRCSRRSVRRCKEMAADHMRRFGSVGQGLVTAGDRAALIFDCDGVLADTERYGHLPAFNQTFEEFGLPVRWPRPTTRTKLLIGGGKERMAQPAHAEFVAAAGAARRRRRARRGRSRPGTGGRPRSTPAMVADGALPARPGVRRIIGAGAPPPAGGWPSPPRRPSRPSGPSLSHVAGPELAAGVRGVRRGRGAGARSRPRTSTCWPLATLGR